MNYCSYSEPKINRENEFYIDVDKELIKILTDFRKNSLNFDDDSEKWLAALTLVSYQDKSGFDFIAKQLDIPDSKSNIYKGMISLDLETISSLFDELSRDIPFDLQVSILRILKGEVNALKDLILKRIQIEKDAKIHGYNMHRIFNMPLSKSLLDISDKLSTYIYDFLYLIGQDILIETEVKSIIKDSSIHEDSLRMMLSINSFINEKFKKPYKIFE